MIIRLHNLSARAPSMDDARAIAELMVIGDSAEVESVVSIEEDIRKGWHASGFSLKDDAWVIVTNKGMVVGYADVRLDGEAACAMLLRVHPDYYDRGIETLLLWLVEIRARVLIRDLCAVLRVTLSHTDQQVRAVVEREGYVKMRRFWRVMIAMEDVADQSLEEAQQSGLLKIDLIIDADNLLKGVPARRRTGMYMARQYDVYEKELNSCMEKGIVMDVDVQQITA